MIEDLVFKRFKTFYVREQIRQEYDSLRSKLEIIKTQIAAESEAGKLKETNLDQFKRLEDDALLMEKDVEKKIAQMQQLDIEISGSKPTNELPEGHQGINETTEALRELLHVTRQYTRQL